MATICMFYGILIRMYLGGKEHNPPHFHAFYQGHKGIFDINTGEMTEGDIPLKQQRAITVWASFHQEELLADWEIAQNDEIPYKIRPLN